MYTTRWTIDDWRTTHDVHATFAQHYTDNRNNDARGTDAFEFTIQVDTRGAGSSESLLVHMNRMAKGMQIGGGGEKGKRQGWWWCGGGGGGGGRVSLRWGVGGVVGFCFCGEAQRQ